MRSRIIGKVVNKDSKLGVVEQVASIICTALEEGKTPWRKSWKSGAVYAQNYDSQYVYRGINALLSGCSSFDTPFFLTKNQILKLGGKLRRGAEATVRVFWEIEGKSSKMKLYEVYNVEEVDGVRFELPTSSSLGDPIHRAEQFLAHIPKRPQIDVNLKSEAAYNVLLDTIYMPQIARFSSAEQYYQMIFLRLIQATGHSSRLNRVGVMEKLRFGKALFDEEGLITEIGGSMLCEIMGISFPELKDGVHYAMRWARVIRENPEMIFFAAAKAKAAVEFLLGEKNN